MPECCHVLLLLLVELLPLIHLLLHAPTMLLLLRITTVVVSVITKTGALGKVLLRHISVVWVRMRDGLTMAWEVILYISLHTVRIVRLLEVAGGPRSRFSWRRR